MPTWGWFLPAWCLSTCHSVATGLLGCSRGSGALVHGSSGSYVS